MELKVFTLPTCPTCSMAKAFASEIAQKLGIICREISLTTDEGRRECQKYDIMSTPSIVIGNEVIARGRLISKEKLEEEVKKCLDNWRQRADKDQS